MSKLIDSIISVFSNNDDREKTFNSAVILAAGNGSRFSESRKKQFAEIAGVPVIVRTAGIFEQCKIIDEIVVVTSANDVDGCRTLLENAGIRKLTKVVAGGADRQKSAKIGFDNINPMCDFVALHDAARCLVTEKIINDTFEAAYQYGASAAAEKVVDTVKRADANGFVTETLDRREIWLAKTPQVFKADVYRAASYMAVKNGISGTDDASLAESLGFRVKLVDCGCENIKLTYPEDAVRMMEILSTREWLERENAVQGKEGDI